MKKSLVMLRNTELARSQKSKEHNLISLAEIYQPGILDKILKKIIVQHFLTCMLQLKATSADLLQLMVLILLIFES